MRLGKRTASAMLAFALAAAVTGTSISVPVPEKVQAAEPEPKETKDTRAAEDVVQSVTIADTYYSVNGKLPIYVEYSTLEELDEEQYENLKLTVTKEDGSIVAQKIEYYSETKSLICIEECSYVQTGKKYPLKFTITDTLSGKTLWEETKTIAFEDKEAWMDVNYLPTGEKSYNNIELNISAGAALVSSSAIDGVYLLDKENKIAAGSRDVSKNIVSSYDSRYGDIFYRRIWPEEWEHCEIHAYGVYRTRKLEAGEVLQAAYSVDGEMFLTEAKVTVTDQPYITGIYRNRELFSGEEDAQVFEVSGKHMDFSKLSFVLKDRETGKEAGRSVSSVASEREYAYYVVRWNEEYKNKTEDWDISFQAEYAYSDDEVELISEKGTGKSLYFTDSYDAIWNPKMDSIEYYNNKIPAGTAVSYEVKDSSYEESIASGSGIITDADHHMVIPLKETFHETGVTYLRVTYLDEEGTEQTTGWNYVFVEKNITDSGSDEETSYRVYSLAMKPMYYLSDKKEFAITAELGCNDKSRLAATASAIISNYEDGAEAGTMELVRNETDDTIVSYQGIYPKTLAVGRYKIKFTPDGENTLSYDFYVQSSDTMGLISITEYFDYGYLRLRFGSQEIADWYCSEENQKKIAVTLVDVTGKEIGTYTGTNGDFTIEEDPIETDPSSFYVYGDYSVTKKIQFSEEVKKKITENYYSDISVYYDRKEAVEAEDPSGMISEQYVHSLESESNVWIEMDHRSGSVYQNGKYTYSRISGSASAFPAVLTITDWYSLKPIKTITAKERNHVITDSDMEGLSETKLYRCYVKGADGSVNSAMGYLSSEGEYQYHNEFWTVFSDLYHVSGDFDVTFEFTNKSDGYHAWENYIVGFANRFEEVSKIPSENKGYQEYYVLRADAYGWSLRSPDKGGGNMTAEGNPVTYTYDWDWAQFEEMMKDSKVTMNIKRTGNDFVVDAKIFGADAKEYSYVTEFTTNADKEMTLFLTSEYAEVSNVVFKNNQETQKPEEKPEDSIGNNGGGTGGNTITQPEKNEPAKEEPKPEETPAEDTEKEEPKPEETPSEDTNKEETKEPEKETAETEEPKKEETKNPSKDKTSTSKAKGKLTLKKTKIVINKGQKAKIKITSKLNTKVTYRSLNKKVAAVSSKGTVTAKKAGKAVIVVKANGKKKKVTVTVKGTSEKNGKQIELEEDFSLSASQAVLKKGSKLTVQKASGLSGKVTFRSLNKKIASVSSKGVIKARKKGKTTILIKNGKKTIKLKLTVSI